MMSTSSAALSALITPWLADRRAGFTTAGKDVQSRSSWTMAKRGWGTPAEAANRRCQSLSSAAETAADGLPGRPSRRATSAATSTASPSVPTTASGTPHRSTSPSAATAGSSNGTHNDEPGIADARSVATTTSHPIDRAASRKAPTR